MQTTESDRDRKWAAAGSSRRLRWAALGLICVGSVAAQVAAQSGSRDGEGMVTFQSNADFATTVGRVEAEVKARGLFVMRVLDHAAAAAQFGRELAPNTVVLFGNPQIGSQVMACAPSVGIDLPQKLQIREEGGAVHVSYNDPAYLVRRHAIVGCDEVLALVTENLRTIARRVAGGT